MSILLGLLLGATSLFLIMLVLVQRGRGGGLAGALGGMGGQSAFGAKAGDVFTRVTIGASFIWIVLCVLSVKMLGGDSQDRLRLDVDAPPANGMSSAPADDPTGTPAPIAPPTGAAQTPALPTPGAAAPADANE